MSRAIALLLLLASAPVRAQDGISVELRAPEGLHAGDRAEITVLVRGAGTYPLLVTPASEGTAIEVVRGRLLRAEAVDPRAELLEFRVPMVAQGPGTAVVRVSVAGYACAERCRLVRAEASTTVRVAPALTGRRKSPKDADADPAPRERTSSLNWVRLPGAEDCASSAEIARAVEERLARRVFVSASEADLAIEGRAERAEGGWRAVIHVSEADGTDLGERTLSSEDSACDALGRLAALAIAIMIDPLTAPDPSSTEEREPEVIVRTERVEVPVPVPVPAEPQPSPPRWRVELDAAVVGSLGLSPTPTLGGLATVIVEPPGFVPIALEGAIFPFSRADRPEGRADFFHVHAGLQICPLAVREAGLALHGCLGADAGALFVLDTDLDVGERERLIGQGHAVLRGHWDVIGILTVRFAVHLLIPFRHDAFTYQGGTRELYVPEPIAGMIDLGAGIHF